MNTERETRPSINTALSSPMRLELVGLFTDPGPLSIADMAARLGRPATSLYHHVQVLEDAGVLQKAGTRPKGKRFETLFELTSNRAELELDSDDEETNRHARKAMSAALRMAERDFDAALERDDLITEGPDRNFLGLRIHIRASSENLAKLNERLKVIDDLLLDQTAVNGEPTSDDQFLSLTVLFAPLRGRSAAGDQGE